MGEVIDDNSIESVDVSLVLEGDFAEPTGEWRVALSSYSDAEQSDWRRVARCWPQ